MKKGILILGLMIAAVGMFFQGKGMKQAVETVGELSHKEHPKVALTFDDGPHAFYTEMLLDGLKERGICATFFLIGKNIEGNEEIVQRMQKEGHLIGNHTYHHVNLKELSQKEAKQEIQKAGNKIYESTGICTAFVRPPFGEWKKNLDLDMTMIPVSWNIDSLDWTTENTEKIIKRVVKDVEEDDIILMHDIYKTSVEAALQIVDILKERGYEFVTVDKLLLE
ncbi:MAG: polysaccharide deacetylase family protein [Firmicutes bacterium]|nr:polysaccharide deacetylase family protein [Bacillota bacterium]